MTLSCRGRRDRKRRGRGECGGEEGSLERGGEGKMGDGEEMEEKGERRWRRRGEKRDEWRKGRLGSELTLGG